MNRISLAPMMRPSLALTLALLVASTFSGCRTAPRLGTQVPRAGDEIMAAGQLIHSGTRVILWSDPNGYDAYRVERRFSPVEESSWEKTREAVTNLTTPNRYSLRNWNLSTQQLEQVRGGGWDLPLLQDKVDQFVLHFDATGTSRQCFKILHDHRDLSIHFMLDLDGTIYQTLDLKERAWHATSSNTRSIGIEIANIGAYPPGLTNTLNRWYEQTADGRIRITIPTNAQPDGIHTRNFVGRPARPKPVEGEIHGKPLVQYDFTPEQYRALAHLTATLCKTFPKIRCDYPRAEDGSPLMTKLPEAELTNYSGVLGHYHIQLNKVDPGPAFQWEKVFKEARRLAGIKSAERFRKITQGHGRMRLD